MVLGRQLNPVSDISGEDQMGVGVLKIETRTE